MNNQIPDSDKTVHDEVPADYKTDPGDGGDRYKKRRALTLRKSWRWWGVGLAVFLALQVLVGMCFDREPELFDVQVTARKNISGGMSPG